jgi:hypothetical protein
MFYVLKLLLGTAYSIEGRAIGIAFSIEEKGWVQTLETIFVFSRVGTQFSASVATPTPVGVPATIRHGNLPVTSGCYVNPHVYYDM